MIRTKKQILRRQILAAVAVHPDRTGASARLSGRLRQLSLWRSARVIYAFVPLASEPDWRGEDAGKIFAYPRIDYGTMNFWLPEGFRRGPLGVEEPVGGELAPPADLVLVPGVAFDHDRHRLGRGRGYYDRWLEGNPEVPTLGICFACQLIDRVPREGHDVPLDAVLAEDRLIASR